MDNQKYYDHLYQCLCDQQENILKQQGKSNIEPPNFGEQIKVWFDQIFMHITENPPVEYVKSIDVKQDSMQNIQEVIYRYAQDHEVPHAVTINIYWL